MSDKKMHKKIFVIGPNKCGSISLNNFFLQNNLNSVHWKQGSIAIKILSNISANLDPLTDLHKYDCILDMYFITKGLYISPLSLIDNIIKNYPNEIYILNIRNYNDWLKSRKSHGDGSLNKRLKITFGENFNYYNEFNGYRKILDYNLPNLHIFDLDKKNKFSKLSSFLLKKGIKIFNTKEVHMHNTQNKN